MFALRRNLTRFPRTTFPLRTIRAESTSQAPQPPKKPSPHGIFYKDFAPTVIKNLLVAVLTYQIIYYSWSKLESLEIKQEKEGEVKALEGELRRLTADKS